MDSEQEPVSKQGQRKELRWMECDACGEPLKVLGHCKYLCVRCGFLRTCMDTI